jgi:hypothetical protein
MRHLVARIPTWVAQSLHCIQLQKPQEHRSESGEVDWCSETCRYLYLRQERTASHSGVAYRGRGIICAIILAVHRGSISCLKTYVSHGREKKAFCFMKIWMESWLLLVPTAVRSRPARTHSHTQNAALCPFFHSLENQLPQCRLRTERPALWALTVPCFMLQIS